MRSSCTSNRHRRCAPSSRSGAGSRTPSASPHAVGFDDALAAYARALGGDPWLERFPFVLRDVTPLRAGDAWFVRDEDGRAFALSRNLREPFALHAVAGGRPLTLAGEWDGREFLPLAAWSGARFTALA